MDPKELKQEIEKHATKVMASDVSGSGHGPSSVHVAFNKLVASYILLQLEKDGERDEQLEDFMPKMLDALKGTPGESKEIRNLRTQNLQLQDYLGQAQNDLRLLAKDVTKYSCEAIGKHSGSLDNARFEMLASQDDPYDLEENQVDVDWEAVHDLRVRAPRHLGFEPEQVEGRAEGMWVYVEKDGTIAFDDCHVTALGYLNEDTAAVYELNDCFEDREVPNAHLRWERRFLYTAQMTKGRQEDLKREMRKREKENR